MRMTKQRHQLLSLFEAHPDQAFNAEGLHHLVGPETMNLSTIYRNVEKLTDDGFLHKTMVASTAFFYTATQEHKHFMICTHCHQLTPIGCFMQQFLPQLAQKHHFAITDHEVTILGLCQNCGS